MMVKTNNKAKIEAFVPFVSVLILFDIADVDNSTMIKSMISAMVAIIPFVSKFMCSPDTVRALVEIALTLDTEEVVVVVVVTVEVVVVMVDEIINDIQAYSYL
ncbi:MAG: hypothetical protein ACE5K4_09230 [Candidatus Hydrothermarchaeota archaeon]